MRLNEVNWRNKASVIKFAKTLGAGQVVIKVPWRPNYNITFADATHRYRPQWVIHRT